MRNKMNFKTTFLRIKDKINIKVKKNNNNQKFN